MKKIIINCPQCTKKMKISNKVAKYKCPHCQHIYKFNTLKLILVNTEKFFMSITDSFINFFKYIPTKWRNFKATYKYMKQMKQHMKADPNWSNYRKQQQEEKKNQVKTSFFDKVKNKFKR